MVICGDRWRLGCFPFLVVWFERFILLRPFRLLHRCLVRTLFIGRVAVLAMQEPVDVGDMD